MLRRGKGILDIEAVIVVHVIVAMCCLLQSTPYMLSVWRHYPYHHCLAAGDRYILLESCENTSYP